MNNDNSGGVIFGGQPLNNSTSFLNTVETGTNSVVPDIINNPVNPIMPNANNESGANIVQAGSGSLVNENAANVVNTTVTPVQENATPIQNDVVSVNNGIGADASTVVVPNVATANNISVENTGISANSGSSTIDVSTGIIPEPVNDSVSNNNSIASQNDAVSNSPILGFDLPSNNATSNNTTANVNVASVNNQAAITPVGDISTADTVPSDTNVSKTSVVSVGKYLGHFLLFAIPIIGFILLIVKIFNKGDENISNFAKAYLLFGVIIVVICSVFAIVGASLFGSVLVNLAG